LRSRTVEGVRTVVARGVDAVDASRSDWVTPIVYAYAFNVQA
jgi:hypothetical protein